MGGHTIYPGGIVIDMLPFNHMELDEEHEILHVQAGARWKDIIPYLERSRPLGRRHAVGQHVFGRRIAQRQLPRLAVRPAADRLDRRKLPPDEGRRQHRPLQPRGRTQELFSLVLGGYGLFGIILDVDLRVVPNERYRLEQFIVPVDEALATFERESASKSRTR